MVIFQGTKRVHLTMADPAVQGNPKRQKKTVFFINNGKTAMGGTTREVLEPQDDGTYKPATMTFLGRQLGKTGFWSNGHLAWDCNRDVYVSSSTSVKWENWSMNDLYKRLRALMMYNKPREAVEVYQEGLVEWMKTDRRLCLTQYAGRFQKEHRFANIALHDEIYPELTEDSFVFY
jgi:hypothetical protein